MTTARRHATENIFKGLCVLATLAVVGVLFLIVGQIFITGFPSLSWYFISTPENATPGLGQGIANAIVGTILLSLCATIVAAPFGFGTAVYMKRYAPDNGVTRSFRFLLEVMSGTPSIVIGVFGFLIFVIYLKPVTGGYSLIAGAVALGMLIMPVIERAIEDAIDRVSPELEEGSYALGANKWQTIRDITIPTAFSGILTGFTLGFGRAAEESAIVILTAGYTQYMPDLGIRPASGSLGGVKIYPLQDQVATLPYAVYHAFQNAAIVKPSAGFAAAFVLIVIVFTINISGKALLARTMSTGNDDNSLICMMRKKLSSGKKISPTAIDNQIELISELSPPMPEPPNQPNPSLAGTVGNLPLLKKISALVVPSEKKRKPSQFQPHDGNEKKRILKANVHTFFLIILPFAIPTVLLLLIAFLAAIPPFHYALGPVNPPLAGLFASGFAGIVTVAGLIFALVFAKRGGTFRAKTRRTGYAAVVAGFCVLCIAGIICSSSAAGFFKTGNEPAAQTGSDRSAKLAAMLAAGELGGDEQGSVVSAQTNTSTTTAPTAIPTQRLGSAMTPNVPMKDALGVGESYWFGDADNACRATVYDYKVLPFYFWYYYDYNRFIQQVPSNVTDLYLVIFLRIENDGKDSAIVPSATQFMVMHGGEGYTNQPFFNTSILDTQQYNLYSALFAGNPSAVSYQWIREIGQQKRDYAFLTGYNPFGQNTTSTINPPTSSGGSSNTNGQGFFLLPGGSNAIDGYLIYEVPKSVIADLNNTYIQVSFNAESWTQWRLGAGS
jgi:phosphate transport system permease protein